MKFKKHTLTLILEGSFGVSNDGDASLSSWRGNSGDPFRISSSQLSLAEKKSNSLITTGFASMEFSTGSLASPARDDIIFPGVFQIKNYLNFFFEE